MKKARFSIKASPHNAASKHPRAGMTPADPQKTVSVPCPSSLRVHKVRLPGSACQPESSLKNRHVHLLSYGFIVAFFHQFSIVFFARLCLK